MHVLVIGTGYVGLVQGVGLASLGHNVTCIDTNQAKIEQLKQGRSPIYEPGLESLLQEQIQTKRLGFTTDFRDYLTAAEVVFIAVGTPSLATGEADLQYCFAALEALAPHLDQQIVVMKSTVPVGTCQEIQNQLFKTSGRQIPVVSNPEFLREGSAVNDFLHPDRIILGGTYQEALKTVEALYAKLKAPVLHVNWETAEMIKYASNAYLATQISFINSLSQLSQRIGADIDQVSAGMKLDHRIGSKAFLKAGLGYGGSCFPKDIRALLALAGKRDITLTLLEEVEAINQQQRQHFVNLVKVQLLELKGKKLAIWGVAFKPGTDDIREAPAITIMTELLNEGAQLTAYDPVAAENASRVLPEVSFTKTALDTCLDADALLIMTEWPEFRDINLDAIKSKLTTPLIFDGRNMYNPIQLAERGFCYYPIGKPSIEKRTVLTYQPLRQAASQKTG